MRQKIVSLEEWENFEHYRNNLSFMIDSIKQIKSNWESHCQYLEEELHCFNDENCLMSEHIEDLLSCFGASDYEYDDDYDNWIHQSKKHKKIKIIIENISDGKL